MESTEELAELRSLVQKQIELSEANHHILKRMVRMGRIAFWFKVAVWTVVLVLPIIFAGQIFSLGKSLFGYPSPVELKALFSGK
jgi:hypothetical protein